MIVKLKTFSFWKKKTEKQAPDVIGRVIIFRANRSQLRPET